MKNIYWFLLILSAFLYALPFLCVHYCWWVIVFFPLPVLYIAWGEDLAFKQGYVWAVVTFLLHVNGGIYVVGCMAEQSWCIGLLLCLCMVLYQALSAGLLFWVALLVARFFMIKRPIVRLFLWGSALLLFVIWTDEYSLWIFGIKEGYPLMHPLIPLVYSPSLLWFLPFLGKHLCMVFFLLLSVVFVVLLRKRDGRALCWFIVFCMPWLYALRFDNVAIKPLCLQFVKKIPFMGHCVNNSSVLIGALQKELKEIIRHFPETEVVVLPESALHCTDLLSKPVLLELLGEKYIGKSIHCIFGSFRWNESGMYCNTAYWIYNGQLQHYFDKRHAMIISERLSWLSFFSWIKNNYCEAEHSIFISSNDRPVFVIADHMMYVPYICSELFFKESPDDYYNNEALIALVNDTEFLRPGAWYIVDLLILLAQLKALLWQREILYVSYAHFLFIDKTGHYSTVE